MHDLHKYGERVKVFWPNGPHDFTIEFDYSEPPCLPGWDEWVVIHGLVVEPDALEYRARQGFFVHPCRGGYTLLPLKRVRPAAPQA